MKRFLLLMALCSLGLLVSGCTQESEPVAPVAQVMQVAVADLNQVLMQSEAGTAGMVFMEELQEDLEQELEALQQMADENQTQASQKAVHDKRNSNKMKLDQEKRRINTILNRNLRQAVDSYREKQGIKMIFPSTTPVSFDETYDVTEGILAEMNAMDIDITAEIDMNTGLVPFEGGVDIQRQ